MTSFRNRVSFIRGPNGASPLLTQGGSRMPESGSYGSVRGALSNERPYRDSCALPATASLSRAAHARQRDVFPRARNRPDRHLDERRRIATAERALERRAQRLRRLRPLGRGAEALGETHEIRIGEVAGDHSFAIEFLLDPTHVAEPAVVEHDGGERNAMLDGARKLVRREHEAAVAVDRQDRHVRPRVLSAKRGRKAPAEIVLVAGREEGARLVHGEEQAGRKADLRDLVDIDAVLRQLGAYRVEERGLRRD